VLNTEPLFEEKKLFETTVTAGKILQMRQD
jgi:hypothetical protein